MIRTMFEPEKLLKDLDLDSLTPKQASQEIKKLSDGTRPDMSSAYYIQRMGGDFDFGGAGGRGVGGMSKLPPSLERLASFVDAKPENVRDIFNYGLCLMMVEAGAIELVETIAGDEGAVCVFRSAAGEEFSATRPRRSEAILVPLQKKPGSLFWKAAVPRTRMTETATLPNWYSLESRR